jgi:hypothetical protein
VSSWWLAEKPFHVVGNQQIPLKIEIELRSLAKQRQQHPQQPPQSARKIVVVEVVLQLKHQLV